MQEKEGVYNVPVYIQAFARSAQEAGNKIESVLDEHLPDEEFPGYQIVEDEAERMDDPLL